MNYVPLIALGEYLNSVVIPDIPIETNFWLIRTKGGYFYDEFVKEKFVALGWNYIDKSTSFNKENIEILKDRVKERYGDLKPGGAIGKCKKFIKEIKRGDYVLIPNAGGTEVAIGIIGEYYEEEIDYKEEITVIKKIDNEESELGKVKCPYKKRRRIEVVMIISSSRMGYKLLKGMTSYHGLSDMNEYAIDILNCVYNCYTYSGKIMYSLNIAKRTPIKAREMSKLMYVVTELFCNITEDDLVSVTVNLNSPGKITVVLEKGYKNLKKGALPLLALYLFVFGGSGFGFEFPGLAGGIIDVIQSCRNMDIEMEMKEEELKSKQLENYKKAIELIEISEETGINVDKILNDLQLANELNSSLKFESNETFAKDREENKE